MSDQRTGTPVILRNGEAATVTGRCNVWDFRLQGFRNKTPNDLELWTNEGRWFGPSTEHALDIITVITPEGQAVAVEGAIA